MFIYFLLNLITFPLIYGRFYENNNNTDFTKCRIHYSRSEGSYKTFYEISEINVDSNLTVDLHFSVLALSDAHILLSPSSTVDRQDPVYEIVLGAGGNTFSDIRRMQKAQVQKSERIKDLLSGLDITSFWIHYDREGLLEVGREGEELSFLSWRDTDPLPIRYFSFCTWPGVDAKWFFDCPRDKNETAISEDIEPDLTDLERLRRDLLKGYNRYVRPLYNHEEILEVYMSFSTEHINLDERAGHLDVKGKLNSKWNDEKLKWDPEVYGGISTFHLFLEEAWRPDITLLNAANIEKDIVGSSMMTVTYDGIVNWFPQVHFITWCNTRQLNFWPNDNHTCDLRFIFGKPRELLRIHFDAKIPPNRNKLWTIVDSSAKEEVTAFDNGDGLKHAVVLQLAIKRESSLYTAIFYTPLLVIATSLLATFWVSPLGSLKITIGCFQILLTSIVMISLGLFLPVHPEVLPNIISLYCWSLYCIMASIFLSTVVINISRKQHIYNIPHTLTRILTTPSIKCILCLPTTEFSDEYGKIYGQSYKKNSTQYTWMLLTTVIDRISFFIFLIFMLIVIFFKY